MGGIDSFSMDRSGSMIAEHGDAVPFVDSIPCEVRQADSIQHIDSLKVTKRRSSECGQKRSSLQIKHTDSLTVSKRRSSTSSSQSDAPSSTRRPSLMLPL